MFLSLDGTFWVQLINFAIFFAILNVVFLRPVSRAIRKRREYINSVAADYDRYQAEAKTLRERADAVRAAARREAEQTLAKARADASNRSSEISAQYAALVTQTVEEAQRTAQGEFDAALANEGALVRKLADAMLERTLVGSGK